MAKSNFIPASDHDFQSWLEHFINTLMPDDGVIDADLTVLKAAIDEFNAKMAHANDMQAQAKQATADKNDSRRNIETLIRAEVRRIKSRSNYNEGRGANLGIEGPENTFNLATAKPDLTGTDQTGGVVALNFSKYKSDGINIYSQRENDVDWVKLDRATVSPFIDNRPLLQVGKPELRRYTAIYMSKDAEIGQYSDDLVVNCAP